MKLTSMLWVAWIGLACASCESGPKPTVENPRFSLKTGGAAAPRVPGDLAALADRLESADVVCLGEEHGNMLGHRRTLQLLQLLHQRRPSLALSLEMIERHQQADLDAWLANDIDTQTYLDRTGLARSYVERYHPMVDFCKRQGIDVIAGNLPRELAGRVRREGPDALGNEPFMPREVSAERDDYWTAFEASMTNEEMAAAHGAMSPEMIASFFVAQCAKDDAMAESIVDYLAGVDGAGGGAPLVFHVVGNFHVEGRLGTVTRLLSRRPDLDVAVVSMESQPSWQALEAPDSYALFVPSLSEMPAEMPAEESAEVETEGGEVLEVPDDPGRPALGFMPDYEASVDGTKVGALRPDGPAERAGLKEGDVIIELDGVAIDGFDAYMEILGSLTPGKTVEVVVERGEEIIKQQITVGERID